MTQAALRAWSGLRRCVGCPALARRHHDDHPVRRVHALRMNIRVEWPEPASVLIMVMFSFLGGAAAYRANVHIAVRGAANAVMPPARAHACSWGVEPAWSRPRSS